MKQKLVRGEKGYLAQKKKMEMVKTVVLFAVPVILFVAGMIATKSRINLLTIVAVLGMLPASRSLVSLIMYLKSHAISEEDYAQIHDLTKNLTGAYDNIFTTYEKTYEVPSVVVRSGNVCGYVATEYKTLDNLEKHLTACIKKEGYAVNVKIFETIEAYQKRLESLNKLKETDIEKDLAVRQILFEVSL